MTEEIIRSRGVVILKRRHAELHELLPLVALGRKLAEKFENGSGRIRKDECRLR